jgi:uncharacterized membrane protein YeiH
VSEFQVPILLDYLATFAWALSGAIVGMRRGYDLTGVFAIALISAVGGSLLRDGIFLNQTPPVLTDPLYIPLFVVATALIAVFARKLREPVNWPLADNLVLALDSLGTPAFAVVGMQLAAAAGVPLPGILLVGVINGTGGGFLRDIIVNEQPLVFRPGHHFATILVAVCLLYLIATRYLGFDSFLTGWSLVVLFLALRWAALRYNVRTKPLRGS